MEEAGSSDDDIITPSPESYRILHSSQQQGSGSGVDVPGPPQESEVIVLDDDEVGSPEDFTPQTRRSSRQTQGAASEAFLQSLRPVQNGRGLQAQTRSLSQRARGRGHASARSRKRPRPSSSNTLDSIFAGSSQGQSLSGSSVTRAASRGSGEGTSDGSSAVAVSSERRPGEARMLTRERSHHNPQPSTLAGNSVLPSTSGRLLMGEDETDSFAFTSHSNVYARGSSQVADRTLDESSAFRSDVSEGDSRQPYGERDDAGEDGTRTTSEHREAADVTRDAAARGAEAEHATHSSDETPPLSPELLAPSTPEDPNALEAVPAAGGSPDLAEGRDTPGDVAMEDDRTGEMETEEGALSQSAGQADVQDAGGDDGGTRVMIQGLSPSFVPRLSDPNVSGTQQPPLSREEGVPSVSGIQPLDQSVGDFVSPSTKRRRLAAAAKDSIQTKTSAESAGSVPGFNESAEDDGDTCTICFEPWTTSGKHRLVCLKCGHLFGQSCIDKWLRGQGAAGQCPQCNAKAKRKDIRVLFTKTIKALDTSERDRALKELEQERESKRKLQLELATLRLRFQVLEDTCSHLREELRTARTQGGSLSRPSSSTAASDTKASLSGHFQLEKTIRVSESGGCRVLAYSPSIAALVISQPSSSPLFPGFGIKKLSTIDFKTSQYLTIHSKMIRDACFHPMVDDGMLLSCSVDKTVKLTNVLGNNVVQSYKTEMPAWSCAWHSTDRNLFYAGLQNGTVLYFDIRNLQEPVSSLNLSSGLVPVLALQHVSPHPASGFRSSGLLVGQLDRISFHEHAGNSVAAHPMPMEGKLTSLTWDAEVNQVLASFRPTSSHPTVRHELWSLSNRQLDAEEGQPVSICSAQLMTTVHGSNRQSLLSRSLLFHHPADRDRLMVAAADEVTNAVHVWDSASGQMMQRLPCDGIALDTTTLSVNNTSFLVSLTEKQLKVHAWKQ